MWNTELVFGQRNSSSLSPLISFLCAGTFSTNVCFATGTTTWCHLEPQAWPSMLLPPHLMSQHSGQPSEFVCRFQEMSCCEINPTSLVPGTNESHGAGRGGKESRVLLSSLLLLTPRQSCSCFLPAAVLLLTIFHWHSNHTHYPRQPHCRAWWLAVHWACALLNCLRIKAKANGFPNGGSGEPRILVGGSLHWQWGVFWDNLAKGGGQKLDEVSELVTGADRWSPGMKDLRTTLLLLLSPPQIKIIKSFLKRRRLGRKWYSS